MEFSIDKLAKDVAEKALDEITYEGKTIREWVEILVKQQPCKNYIDKEALIEELKLGFLINELQEAKNDPCIIDKMIDWAIRTVKRQPSVTLKTSCESCREQVLKHLEKEDWADTVNCVMNMPFINKPCISEGVCREDKIKVLDKIRAELIQSIQNGTLKIESGNEELFRIINKYKYRTEIEVNEEVVQCKDCISRKAVLSYIERILNQGTGKKKSFQFIRKFVESLPSIQPKPKTDALDKIRAEIKALTDGAEPERIWNVDALAIIDKYKTESEE